MTPEVKQPTIQQKQWEPLQIHDNSKKEKRTATAWKSSFRRSWPCFPCRAVTARYTTAPCKANLPAPARNVITPFLVGFDGCLVMARSWLVRDLLFIGLHTNRAYSKWVAQRCVTGVCTFYVMVLVASCTLGQSVTDASEA